MLNDAWAQIAAQRGDLFGWAPVLFGIGITGYFASPVEPAVLTIYSILGLTVVLLAALFVISERASILITAIALLFGGFGIAGLRANMVAEPVL